MQWRISSKLINRKLKISHLQMLQSFAFNVPWWREPRLDPFEHWKINYYSYTLNELFEQCFLLTALSFMLIKPSEEFCFLPHGSYMPMNQFFQLSLRQNLNSFSCMKLDEFVCVENNNSSETENIYLLDLIYIEPTQTFEFQNNWSNDQNVLKSMRGQTLRTRHILSKCN